VAKEGASVKAGDTLFELETDKAVVPVPADFTGTVKKLLVKEGATVKVGTAILSFEGTIGSSGAPKAASPSTPTQTPPPAKAPAPKSATGVPPVAFVSSTGKLVAAGPATRKLARELGVDLGKVPGSARGGRVNVEDVKRYVKSVMQGGAQAGGGARAPLNLPDFSVFGRTRREPLTKLRKIIASRLSDSWNRIPHVHQFQDVDVTDLVELQKKHGEAFKEKGSALSVTLFMIKGLAEALKTHPSFNASLDEANNELIYKEYFNIGVAVDTPEGLIVPVLKNVDKMSIFDIGFQLKEIAKKARERKVMPADLMGASITLSNLGGIGGTHFTPIVNPPEVAILGAGRNQTKPVWVKDAFVPRSILPICLAYDHRVIDGADGARFTVFLTQYLENWAKTNPVEALGLK
ncbi:MAG: 2-oxo acid dehydrogenase subunit E2, partial [Spirochaetia bacterium]|nr:2-oxo acid dehydrogenase subunit E2 [Spirochaetia bacterium]